MRKLILIASLSVLSACSIKAPITHQYQLTSFSAKQWVKTPSHNTVFVTQPEAMEGYQTNQMQYSTAPFVLNNFTKNGWMSPPASMLYPLLIQSLQHSGYFYAVASGAYTSTTDYRLDTQLLEIQQNFITKPSVFNIKIKAIITRVSDNHILSSRIFSQHIPCPQDSPYGGVIAANRATLALTKEITQFVITRIKHSDLPK